jgi:hypothetical protein
MYEADEPDTELGKKLGLYLCYDNKIIFIHPLSNIKHYRLDEVISFIKNHAYNIDKDANIEVSMITCRSYINYSPTLLEKKKKKYKVLQTLNPDVELAEMFSNISLNKEKKDVYNLKVWDFEDRDVFDIHPAECIVEGKPVDKREQYGCAIQTLVYLGELKDRNRAMREVSKATQHKTSTINKMYDILYENTMKQDKRKKLYLTQTFEFFDDHYNIISMSHIKNFCNKLKNNQGTLIKINRKNSELSHVVALVKYENICYIIDPQQVKKYTIKEFENFINKHKYTNYFGSFDVIFENASREKRLISSSSSSSKNRKTKKARANTRKTKTKQHKKGKSKSPLLTKRSKSHLVSTRRIKSI